MMLRRIFPILLFSLLVSNLFATDSRTVLELEGGRFEFTRSLPVKMVYVGKRIIEKPVEPPPVKESPPPTECKDGGLLGNVDCEVTQRMDNVGRTGKTAETPENAPQTVKEEVPLRAELKGSVTIKMDVAEEGKSYRLSLNPQLSAVTLSGPFEGNTRNAIVRDEISLKKALSKWEATIEEENLSQLKEDGQIEFDIGHLFAGTALLKRQRPDPAKVLVYYRPDYCDRLEIEFLEAQQTYLELEASIPLMEQFELVTRTLDEMNDALVGTAEETTKATDEGDKVYDQSPAIAEKLIGPAFIQINIFLLIVFLPAVNSRGFKFVLGIPQIFLGLVKRFLSGGKLSKFHLLAFTGVFRFGCSILDVGNHTGLVLGFRNGIVMAFIDQPVSQHLHLPEGIELFLFEFLEI
ncbi:hypothetical protein ACFL03_15395 [Thermodesulfobacteriota bacterium]